MQCMLCAISKAGIRYYELIRQTPLVQWVSGCELQQQDISISSYVLDPTAATPISRQVTG